MGITVSGIRVFSSSAPAVSSPGDSARTPSAGVAPLNVSESAGVVSPTEATSIPSSAVPVDSTASSTEEDVALDPFLDIDKLASADHPIGGNNLTAVKTEVCFTRFSVSVCLLPVLVISSNAQ